MTEVQLEKFISNSSIQELKRIWNIVFKEWEDMPDLDTAKEVLIDELPDLNKTQIKKIVELFEEDNDNEE